MYSIGGHWDRQGRGWVPRKKSNSQLSHKTANAGSGNYTKYARDLDAVEGFYYS